MKREILFKAKKQTSKMWYFGDYWFNAFTKEHYLKCLTEGGTQYEDIKIDIKTLCQFTGKLDINKNKIFEGDVINCYDYHDDEPYKTTVRFKDGGFLVDVRGCDYDVTCIAFLDDDTEIEITSNIHD